MTIAIIEQDAVYRQGIEVLLQPVSDAIISYDSVAGLSEDLQTKGGDASPIKVLILGDLMMSNQAMLESLENHQSDLAETKIIRIGNQILMPIIEQMLDHMIWSYIYKSEVADHLHHLVQRAMDDVRSGSMILPTEILGHEDVDLPSLKMLSYRDTQLLEWLANDYTIDQMALELGVSSQTVWRCRSRLAKYFGVTGSHMIVSKAKDLGFLN